MSTSLNQQRTHQQLLYERQQNSQGQNGQNHQQHDSGIGIGNSVGNGNGNGNDGNINNGDISNGQMNFVAMPYGDQNHVHVHSQSPMTTEHLSNHDRQTGHYREDGQDMVVDSRGNRVHTGHTGTDGRSEDFSVSPVREPENETEEPENMSVVSVGNEEEFESDVTKRRRLRAERDKVSIYNNNNSL